MSLQLSVEQILTKLEAQMAMHRDSEAHHAQQEVFHREQRAVHAAEYEVVAKHYEAFKATAGTAAEVAARTMAAIPEPSKEEAPKEKPMPFRIPLPSRLVARWVEQSPKGEVFVPSTVAVEVNRLFSRELRKPMDARLASAALRRLAATGGARLVQKGTPYHEAVYTRS